MIVRLFPPAATRSADFFEEDRDSAVLGGLRSKSWLKPISHLSIDVMK